MARYQGLRIDEWLVAKLEGWLGAGINRERIKVVNLRGGEDGSLGFPGFTFRYDRDLYGSGMKCLNVIPSRKSLEKAREAVRGRTSPKKFQKPTPAVVEDLDSFLRGWANCFEYGYPRKAFRDMGTPRASG